MHSAGICVWKLRSVTRSHREHSPSRGRDPSLGSPEYEAGALTTQPRSSVKFLKKSFHLPLIYFSSYNSFSVQKCNELKIVWILPRSWPNCSPLGQTTCSLLWLAYPDKFTLSITWYSPCILLHDQLLCRLYIDLWLLPRSCFRLLWRHFHKDVYSLLSVYRDLSGAAVNVPV
jgi:hypothetical protein